MKAIRVDAPGRLAIVDVPDPRLSGDDEVLVKVRMAGICGSDLHIQDGSSPVATYPRIIGHEFAGEVVAAGASVAALKAGDRVAVDPVIGCGTCPACRAGRPNVCFALRVRGVHVDGGFQEYVAVPAAAAYKVASNLPWERAALVEPYSIAAQVASRAGIKPSDTVLVMGAGPIGLCILQAAKRLGARTIVSELIPERLGLAARMGADVAIDAAREKVRDRVKEETGGMGPPVVVDTVCTTRSAQEAVELACNAGRVILLGFDGAPTGITQLSIVAKELDVRGSRLNARRFPEVISWFEKEEIDTTCFVSAIFPFQEVAAAFSRIRGEPKSTIKVLLRFD